MKELLRDGLERSGLLLEPEVCRALETFLAELLRWNRRVNLTAISDPAEAVEKHLVDSLLLLPLLGGATSLLDMGSGAGLPGIPLQLARPELRVVSVDSVGKKINFQRHVKRLLGLGRFTPVHARLENLADELAQNETFEVVTARAFASLELIVQLGAPRRSPAGRILAMKGPDGEAEALAAAKISADAGLRIERIHKYRLPFSGAERQVIVLS